MDIYGQYAVAFLVNFEGLVLQQRSLCSNLRGLRRSHHLWDMLEVGQSGKAFADLVRASQFGKAPMV